VATWPAGQIYSRLPDYTIQHGRYQNRTVFRIRSPGLTAHSQWDECR